jgi:hypothetical protein
MIHSLKASNIEVKGLFLNADGGFDTKEFREYCQAEEIIGNIAVNPRNGNNETYLFDELII